MGHQPIFTAGGWPHFAGVSAAQRSAEPTSHATGCTDRPCYRKVHCFAFPDQTECRPRKLSPLPRALAPRARRSSCLTARSGITASRTWTRPATSSPSELGLGGGGSGLIRALEALLERVSPARRGYPRRRSLRTVSHAVVQVCVDWRHWRRLGESLGKLALATAATLLQGPAAPAGCHDRFMRPWRVCERRDAQVCARLPAHLCSAPRRAC